MATLEPVVAAIAAYLFLGEYFSPLGHVGAGLILAAVVSTLYDRNRDPGMASS